MNIGSPWSPGGHGRRTRRCRDEREAAIAVKEEKREMEGEITESLRNRMFRIMLDNGRKMIGYTAGKKVEGSPYDLDRGRIVYRLR